MTCNSFRGRAAAAFLALAAASAFVAGCGGVGTGGTGFGASAPPSPAVFAQGPISGFGSIVVGGRHYDESTGTIADDDGRPLDPSELRLGMTVDVDGTDIGQPTIPATAIRVRTDLVGPVDTAYDAASGTLVVMGQPVRIGAGTALDAFAGGAAGIGAGSVVAVSALYDAAGGVYVATRIDPATGATAYAVRGAVAALDAGALTFQVGSQVFDYAAAAPPAGLANGQVVRVRVQATPASPAHWTVVDFGTGAAVPGSGRTGELEGVVGALADARHFVVAGVPVDASAAAFLPAGAAVAAQARVEVTGRMVEGVLVATQVDVEAGDDGGAGSGGAIEIEGAILTAVDTVHRTFGMRGPTRVDYAGASFDGGTAADLAIGKRVEVRGTLSADGTQVVATRIEFAH